MESSHGQGAPLNHTKGLCPFQVGQRATIEVASTRVISVFSVEPRLEKPGDRWQGPSAWTSPGEEAVQ